MQSRCPYAKEKWDTFLINVHVGKSELTNLYNKLNIPTTILSTSYIYLVIHISERASGKAMPAIICFNQYLKQVSRHKILERFTKTSAISKTKCCSYEAINLVRLFWFLFLPSNNQSQVEFFCVYKAACTFFPVPSISNE